MPTLPALPDLIRHVVASVDAARYVDEPFGHLEYDHFFPPDVYQEMLAALPGPTDYRPMSGRTKDTATVNGVPTRVKLDLFPEYIRRLESEKQAVWSLVGQALCSPELKAAFIRRLAPGLQRRFGPGYATTAFYPIPILTRDIPGYMIPPHPDTHWKAITVQIYLPATAAHPQVGTIFHRQLPDGSLPKVRQMQFVPNSGYAFAVAGDTWHSADPVGPEVTSRDSILQTYFVDAGLKHFARNRARRFGNMLRNEWRYLIG